MIERLSLKGLGRLGIPFEQAVEVCVGAGATGMGLHERDLPTTGDRATADLFVAHGLRATMAIPALATVLPGGEDAGPDDVEERIALICSSVRRFAIFDPTAILIRLGSGGGRSEGELRAVLVAALRKIARVAGEVCPQGLRVAVLTDEAPGVGRELGRGTVPEIVAAVGEENLALAYDAGREGFSASVLERLALVADDLAGVRLPDQLLADATDGPVRLLRAVKQAGYDGWYELDVAGIPPPEGDPSTVLAERVRAFQAVNATATV